MSIHPPGIKKSSVPIGNPQNKMVQNLVSSSKLVTTEIWDESIKQPWLFEKDKPGLYQLKTEWILGSHYTITKISNNKDELVYYYCDICSQVKKNKQDFELVDWYLDIMKFPNGEMKIDDQDEFNEAVTLGYLTLEQKNIAEKALLEAIEVLKSLS